MPAPTTAPLIANVDISVNGKVLTEDLQSHLVDVSVDLDVNIPSMFSMTFSGRASLSEGLDWLDDRTFEIGNEVTIKMGYESRLEPVINGEITSLEPEFSTMGPSSLTVRGFDRRHRLQRGQKTRTFLKLKDSDIAAQIASESGLSGDTTDSKIVHDYLLQANQTDLAFLQERAARINYEVIVQDKKLLFHPMRNDASPTIKMRFGSDELVTFYPRLSSVQQISQTLVSGWDIKEKKSITAKSKKTAARSNMGGDHNGAAIAEKAFGEAKLSTTDPIASQAEADQQAIAHLNGRVIELITGEGTCVGRNDLIPGNTLRITELSKKFSGNYYITGVTHRFRSDRGYITEFRVKRNAI
ncbi:MAG: phage late control D family protein [Alkalinema sp. RU_4_3]|nr:phage late control D family protein [Alkalinema sp. RU_4_3]